MLAELLLRRAGALRQHAQGAHDGYRVVLVSSLRDDVLEETFLGAVHLVAEAAVILAENGIEVIFQAMDGEFDKCGER